MKPDHRKRRRTEPKPLGYWKDYERERKIGGKQFKIGFRQVLKAVDEFLETHQCYGSQIRCALINWITMKIYSLSIRGLVEEYGRKPSIRRDTNLMHAPSKSWIHKWLGRMPVDLLDSLLTLTAGSDAFGTLSVDSTQHQYNRYVLVEDAGRGKYYKKDTIKHHVLIGENGNVVASFVTSGNTHDSPILRVLCLKVPYGKGYLLGDKAYCSVKNCKMAARLGRRPCMPPKKNYNGHGYSPWAKMIRWRAKHPGTFYKVYGRRNTVESCFSVIKDRFNFRIRSVTLEMQKRELAVMSICRNLFL